MTFVIREERAGDEAEIRRVVTAAFGGPAEADLVEALRASDAWLPGLSQAAIDGVRGRAEYAPAFGAFECVPLQAVNEG